MRSHSGEPIHYGGPRFCCCLLNALTRSFWLGPSFPCAVFSRPCSKRACMLGVAMHMQSVLAHTTHGSGDPMPNCEPMQRYVPLARMRSGLRKALKGHCSANEIDQIISKICGAYATDCVCVRARARVCPWDLCKSLFECVDKLTRGLSLQLNGCGLRWRWRSEPLYAADEDYSGPRRRVLLSR